MEANNISQLIRANAGSKMIREAEQMIAYDCVSELLGEQQQAEAVERIKRFHMEYPLLEKETPPNLLNFSEIAQFSSKELQEIPSIYLEILRSLTWYNETTAAFLNEAITQALKEVYRSPLTTVVNNRDAFEYVYTKWYQESESFINSSNKMALGITFDEASLAFSNGEKERYERVQSSASAVEAIKEHNRILEQLRALGDYGPYDVDETCGGGMGPPPSPEPQPLINALFAAFDRAAKK